ncbi:YtxH domain-containing protein [Bacillus sp. 31A1R]|uniref:YtxH domain-containing protein n=1 Tax=Robertmurraya mangrovi TaxID=3098077 RepID=A0ABU5IZI8_9BACI|nr:YtxH domain-containing protein [Bacillus sp. 31A1R]MDZ5472551.1 YtxH domain-containing protein [Bacillus sp. 31A1R]
MMASQERKSYDQEARREESINSKDFIIGALIGGIVGAATALFLAPKSGRELRSDLNSQAVTLREKTGHIKDVAMTKGTELAEVAKEKTTSISHVVSKQSNELLNKVKVGKIQEFLNHNEQMDVDSSNKYEDIQRKLEETKKAFDQTESKLN